MSKIELNEIKKKIRSKSVNKIRQKLNIDNNKTGKNPIFEYVYTHTQIRYVNFALIFFFCFYSSLRLLDCLRYQIEMTEREIGIS